MRRPKRHTFSRISSAVFVHLNGLASSLCASTFAADNHDLAKFPSKVDGSVATRRAPPEQPSYQPANKQACPCPALSFPAAATSSPGAALSAGWARIEALQRNKAFIEQVRDTRNEKLAGREVVFPAGTWWIHRFAGAKRAEPEGAVPPA